MNHTVDAIKRILSKIKADPELYGRLHDRSDLVADVGLDSLEMLQLMLEIEATLRLEIDFDKLDYSYLRSIDALAGFLDSMPTRSS